MLTRLCCFAGAWSMSADTAFKSAAEPHRNSYSCRSLEMVSIVPWS